MSMAPPILTHEGVERSISEMWESLREIPAADDSRDDAYRSAHEAERRLRGQLAEQDRLFAAAPYYRSAVQQMLNNEDCGGDGWWRAWEQLKHAHAMAMGTTSPITGQSTVAMSKTETH